MATKSLKKSKLMKKYKIVKEELDTIQKKFKKVNSKVEKLIDYLDVEEEEYIDPGYSGSIYGFPVGMKSVIRTRFIKRKFTKK